MFIGSYQAGTAKLKRKRPRGEDVLLKTVTVTEGPGSEKGLH